MSFQLSSQEHKKKRKITFSSIIKCHNIENTTECDFRKDFDANKYPDIYVSKTIVQKKIDSKIA